MREDARCSGLRIVEGVLEERSDGGFTLNFTLKGRPVLVLEGVAKVDGPDVVVTNANFLVSP